LIDVLRNGTPERRDQCRAAARLGGFLSGVTRRRRRSLRAPSPRARANRRGRQNASQAPDFFLPADKRFAPPKKVSPYPFKEITPQSQTPKAATEPPRFRAERKAPEPFASPVAPLRAVAYRGLGMEFGRIVRESLDLGEIRENLKQAWSRVTLEPLTVADVERLDCLLSQAEGHRRKLQGTPARRRRSAPRPAQEPKEPPMSSDPDDDTRAYLAALKARAAAVTTPAPPPRPAPVLEPLVKTPPAWLKVIADPPSDFRARVARRRLELEAGITQTVQTAPKTPPEK